MMKYPLPDCGFHSVYRSFHSIYLQQTARCPNNCLFCAYIKDYKAPETQEFILKNRDMSLEELEHILMTIPDFKGFVSLGMAGEGMLLTDMPARIRLIKKHWPGSRCSLTTTFNVYHGDEFIRALFESGLDNLDISCYAHTAEDYERIHGSRLFSGLCKNIEALGALPPEYAAKVDLMFFNETDRIFHVANPAEKLKTFIEFASRHGIRRFNGHEHFEWKRAHPLNGKAAWALPSPCSAVWGEKAGILNIHANLDVVPCCMFTDSRFVLGNLGRESLQTVFTSENWNRFYTAWWEMRPQDIPVCNSCENYADSSRPEELARLAAWQARAVRGKRVFFWGAGEAFRAYGSFFASSQPVGLLLDTGGGLPDAIDGIPVMRPGDIRPEDASLPLVIFAAPRASARILRQLKELYTNYTPETVIICPANSFLTAAGSAAPGSADPREARA